jgi:hypothetical protein
VNKSSKNAKIIKTIFSGTEDLAQPGEINKMDLRQLFNFYLLFILYVIAIAFVIVVG